jgi:poly [ADP-ribose] polymerase
MATKPVKVQKTSELKDFTVTKVVELNFFDLTGEKSHTFGTSNKAYHLEAHLSTSGDIELFSMYGATGKIQAKEYRYFGKDVAAAEKEFDKIIKSKIRKGYVEVDVAQRAIGSEGAKQITKEVILKDATIAPTVKKSNLHIETQRLISDLMGSTNKFVIETLKCPLGQLTNSQIDYGREILNQAKAVVKSDSPKQDELLALTNKFYGAIPHNLGCGARGKMTELLLDSVSKIDQKEYDLDTLLDAKAIGAILTDNSVDVQYNSLDTEFTFINHNDGIFNWLNSLIQDTRASNHKQLGKIVLLNAWSINRKGEEENFLNSVNRISPNCGKQVIPHQLSSLVFDRPNGNSSLFKSANVIPLFHGTRTQNITGILKKGILIRPSGVVICGAMYGNAIYFGMSSKSINYTSIHSAYWSGGKDSKAYLFVSDCALGNQLIARGSYQYSEHNIKPSHSVWAKGGQSGVINDEFMLYNTTQHNLKYLIEFSCK